MHRSPEMNSRGSATLISLLILLVITAFGVTLMTSAKVDTQIAANQTRATQALFSAESGIAEALGRINSEDLLPAGTPDPGWGIYVVEESGRSSADPFLDFTAGDGLDNDGDGTVDEPNERYPEVASKITGHQDGTARNGAKAMTPVSSSSPPWVRIEYARDASGQVILFGNHDDNPYTPHRFNTASGEPVVQVTSAGWRGSADRVVQVRALRKPVYLPPSAIYQPGGDVGFNGNAHVVSGEDWDPHTGTRTGKPPVHAIAAGDSTGKAKAIGQATNNNNLKGRTAPGEPSVGQLTDAFDITGTFDELIEVADIVTSSVGSGWGGLDDPKVVYFQGDLSVSGNWSGGGVLLVDGDFRMTGQAIWYGVIMVKGDATLMGGGNGKHVFGSVLATGHIQVGGNADILYSSETVEALHQFGKYVVQGWKEM